jgi:hypothetical protein
VPANDSPEDECGEVIDVGTVGVGVGLCVGVGEVVTPPELGVGVGEGVGEGVPPPGTGVGVGAGVGVDVVAKVAET